MTSARQTLAMRSRQEAAKVFAGWVSGLTKKQRPVPTFYADGSFEWVRPSQWIQSQSLR